MENLTIRRETEKDYKTVENLTREAFWNVYRPGCCEHYVVHTLRDDPDFVPELDYVMELNGVLIGHVMFVRAEIESDDGRAVPVMTLGPISIHPDYQRKGYRREHCFLWKIWIYSGEHARNSLLCRAEERDSSLLSYS